MNQDKRWRREALAKLTPGMRVLDLGCGTGDLALAALEKVGTQGEVIGLDFSEKMLSAAAERYKKLGLNGGHNFKLVLKRAEELPLPAEPYDAVVSGFVLRNLYESIDSVLEGVRRSLRPGGRISFLDITEPGNVLVRFLWKAYMRSLVVFYGKVLFGGKYPASYLTQSAARFPKAPAFTHKLKDAGFVEVEAKSFMLGVVTLYQAVKP